MSFKFSKLSPYAFKDSALFLGRDPETGKEIGIETERNAITIGGAGGGKGACLIIPNLQRWPHSALVIDPKGENAEMTWEQRISRGQRVGVLDPFRAAKVPDELRVSVDLLASIDPDSVTAREDVLAIADGIVKRENDREPMWDNGAATIIAGVIAFVMSAPPQYRTFTEVRKVLLTPFGGPASDSNPSWGLYADAERMAHCATCGGLARAAASSIMTAIKGGRGADAEFLSGAIRHTAWLDNEAVAACLSASETTFKLEELAQNNATLYLVLPYRYLDAQAAMLRLVVRVAQNTIAAAGNKRGNHCLFILDEFFTLGRLDEIAKAAGNMRSYGLQIWPFLQDLGQLRKLYGDKESETFFANADAHCFFANNDSQTLDYISQRIGKLKPDEVAGILPFMKAFFPLFHRRFWMTEAYARDRHQVKNKNARMKYEHALRRTGSLRFEGQEIAALTGKHPGDTVARSQIVFAPAGQILNVKLAAFFDHYEAYGYMVKTNWALDKLYWKNLFHDVSLNVTDPDSYVSMLKYFCGIMGAGLIAINIYRWNYSLDWYTPEIQDAILAASIVLLFSILSAAGRAHFMGKFISRYHVTYAHRVELFEKQNKQDSIKELIRSRSGSTMESS